MNFSAVAAVFRFECQRMLTAARVFGWIALTLFPPIIIALVRIRAGGSGDWQRYALLSMIPFVLCLLHLLLWVTPNVHSELEGKGWIYLAVRPAGRVSLLLGKYAAAIARTLLSAWIALTLASLIAVPDDGLQLWVVLFFLSLLSCLSYGAIFSLLGVLFHRRAMVIAVAFTLIFELLIGTLPAVVNQMTIQFRIRSLYATWMGEGDLPPELFSQAPWPTHVAVLLVATAATIAVACWIINRREYVRAAQE